MRAMRGWCVALVLVLSSSSAAAEPTVSAAALEKRRVDGYSKAEVDEDTAYWLGLETYPPDALTAEVDVCVTRKGRIASVALAASSGYPTFDQSVLDEIATTWRFKPYRRKKKAIAVCARFTRTARTDVDGVTSGFECTDCPPVDVAPPSPPPPAPTIVSAAQLDALRVSGDPSIPPDQADAGDLRVAVRICVTDAGRVDKVVIATPSGSPAYDAKVKATIRTWRYAPFRPPTAACADTTIRHDAP
jgi:TonB family protein